MPWRRHFGIGRGRVRPGGECRTAALAAFLVGCASNDILFAAKGSAGARRQVNFWFIRRFGATRDFRWRQSRCTGVLPSAMERAEKQTNPAGSALQVSDKDKAMPAVGLWIKTLTIGASDFAVHLVCRRQVEFCGARADSISNVPIQKDSVESSDPPSGDAEGVADRATNVCAVSGCEDQQAKRTRCVEETTCTPPRKTKGNSALATCRLSFRMRWRQRLASKRIGEESSASARPPSALRHTLKASDSAMPAASKYSKDAAHI